MTKKKEGRRGKPASQNKGGLTPQQKQAFEWLQEAAQKEGPEPSSEKMAQFLGYHFYVAEKKNQ